MQPLDRIRTPVIAVPARNEARMLPRIVASLAAQDWLDGGRQLDVVVVLNNCNDTSRAVLEQAVRCHPGLVLHLLDVQLEGAEAHVGTARRMAMDTGARLYGDPAACAVLTTDADAMPAPDWVCANLAAIQDGADLVGGQVVGDPEEERLLGAAFLRRAALHATYEHLVDRLADMIDPLPYDTLPRHGNHIGASLAVRGEVYTAVGGLPPLPVREDLGLVSRVRAAGYRVRHALSVRVVVSARLDGRAAGGMASCLRDWVRDAAEDRPLMVEAAEAVYARLLRRRRLRDMDLSGTTDPRHLARLLGARTDDLGGPGEPLSTAMLIEKLAPETEHSGRYQTVERAIAELEAMIAPKQDQERAA